MNEQPTVKSEQPRNLCIIPARGGSKRIPRKNVKDFLGRPIIEYVIDNALASNCFNEIIISTDSDETSNIIEKFEGVELMWRSKVNSSDTAPMVDVLEEVVNNLESKGKFFENVFLVFPTAIFFKPEDAGIALNMLDNENFDSIIPVGKFAYPIWRGYTLNEIGRLEMLWPEYLMTRTQDLPTVYRDIGQWYAFKLNSFKRTGQVLTGNTGTVFYSELDYQDIDDITDWKIAEFKFQTINKITKA